MKGYFRDLVQIVIIINFAFCMGACAGGNKRLSEMPHDNAIAAVVNPFNSTCYDWRGEKIPCDFKRQYAELLLDKAIPDPRFIDNKNGTLTDNLTGLIWGFLNNK